MKNISKGITFLLICICIQFLLAGCADDVCTNKIIKRVESPNHKFIAYYFTRDGGATTDTSYQLSILKKGKNFGNESGNVFVTYGKFKIKWKSSKKLLVYFGSSEEVFKKRTKYNGITIKYTY